MVGSISTVELIRVINKRRTSAGAVVWIKLPPRSSANADRQTQPPRANLRPARAVNFNKTATAVQGLNIINILLPPPPPLPHLFLYINDPTALFCRFNGMMKFIFYLFFLITFLHK